MEHTESLQNEMSWPTASLLSLTEDPVFFDTTNTYFKTEEHGPSELKACSKSKDKRDDLGWSPWLAVSREGISLRCWVLPVNQHDGQSMAQVHLDLNNLWQ